MWRRAGGERPDAGPFSLAAADRTSWLSSISALKEAGFNQTRLNRETVIDALVDASGIILPNSSLGSEDYANMVVAIANVVPFSDSSLCMRGCDVIDRIVRAAEVTLNARQVDTVLGWLLKVIQAVSTSGLPGGSTPLSATAAAFEQRSLVACALRCIGCTVFENADRCSRWTDPLTKLLLSAMAPPAAVAMSPPAHSAGGIGGTSAGSGSVAGLDATASGFTFVAAADDILSASLVVTGNLLIKAGSKMKDKHALLFPALLRVLVWGSSLPARSLPAVEHAGRVLSAALRALQAILQIAHAPGSGSGVGGAPIGSIGGIGGSGVGMVGGVGSSERRAIVDAVQKSSEDLLRVLHKLSTFGWECGSLGPHAHVQGGGRRRRDATAPSATGHAGAVGGAAAGTSASPCPRGTREATSSRRSSASTGRRSRSRAGSAGQPLSPGGTPERPGGAESGGEVEGMERDSDGGGSVTSASTHSGRSEARAARWQGGRGAGAGGGGSRSGASWYTDSDEEEGEGGGDPDGDHDGEGGDSAGMSFGLGGGASRRKRVPIRVRVTALHCIISVARAQPRLVHSRWALFIPQVEGTSPRPFTPSLLTVILYDQSRRVKEAAAGALAAVVDGAPLTHWVALREKHDSAASLTGTGGHAPPAAPAGRRTVASLSDKTCAMLAELHGGLRKALAMAVGPGSAPALGAGTEGSVAGVGVSRSAGQIAGLLRACAALVAITPYDRLPLPRLKGRAGPGSPMCSPLCTRAVALLSSTAPAVSLAALHTISAAFSNPTAVADSVHGEGTGASSAGAGAVPPPVAADMLGALIAHCNSASLGSAFAAAILRAEVLVVMARAAKHRAVLITSCWTALRPLLRESFVDPSPAVRRGALSVVEELLHARAVALAVLVPIGAKEREKEGGEGGEEGEDGEGGDGPAPPLAVGGATDWTVLDTTGEGGLGMSELLTVYLRAGLRDTAPNVRAGAAMAVSYTLPGDWLCTVEVGVRDELLSTLAAAAFDPAPPVRVAAARAWGAFLAYPEWRMSRPFAGLAGRVLLGSLNDDNVSVRAKASWALGNLCAPMATPTATAAGLAQAVRHGAGSARLQPWHFPGSAELPDPAFTLYPSPGESLPPAAPLVLLPRACACVQEAVEGARGASTGGGRGAPQPLVLAPLEQAFPGASPSLLVSLLGLPLLRVVTQAALRASADTDKVACTAVRTLGYCVQGILTHWLPLPPSMRELVNPVILQGPGGGGGALHTHAHSLTAVRAHTLPCPDDALLKAAMLALADIIAAGGGGSGSTPLPALPPRSVEVGEALPQGEEEDVRAVIARRLHTPELVRHMAMAEAEGEGVGVGALPVSPPAPSPARFQFGTNERGGQGGHAGAGARVWGDRSRPTPADTATSWRRGPGGGAAPAAAQHREAQAPSGPPPDPDKARDKASPGAVKVRWNACHAVAQIVPLAHRCVMTHPAEARARGGEGEGGGGDTAMPPLPEQQDAPLPLHLLYSSSGGQLLSSPSPPRPRVRKEVSCGTSTVWAGVDHISTAHSPFMPRGMGMTLQGALPPTSAGCEVVEGAPVGSVGVGHDPGTPSTPERHSTTRQVVTDPTLPSVCIGVTWVPPILAALQLALALCDNFKVRIASAQALGAVPSRDAYSVPSLGREGAVGHPPYPALPPHQHYMAPALQRPGFDAYPTALASLTAALEASEAPRDYVEYRYKDALKGSIRAALARTIRLAERADYGRMKGWFDSGAAALLADWLAAEEAILPHAPTHALHTEEAPPGSPARSLEDTPTFSASYPPFGALAPCAGVDASTVRACWRTLTAMFKSRVKTLPSAELLRRYETKAAYWTGMGGAAAEGGQGGAR